MTELSLSVAEPFTSPAWGANFVVFSGDGPLVVEEQVKAYLGRACKYARHYGVYLVPERFLLMGYQCMCLISPDGKVLGAQKATHLNLANRAGKRSSQLDAFQTEFGSVALCVDADVYHPEISRILEGMGAQIMICSQVLSRAEYGSHLVLAGVWNASQISRCYAVGVSNQYNCVCAPLELTAQNDGFIVPPNLKLPMTARLQANKLDTIPKKSALNRKFYALHRDELLH